MNELINKISYLDWDFYDNFKFIDNQVLKFNLTNVNIKSLTFQPLIGLLIKYFKIDHYTEFGIGSGTNFFTTCQYIEYAQLSCHAYGIGLYDVPPEKINDLKHDDLLISRNLFKDNTFPFAQISDFSRHGDLNEQIDKEFPGLFVFNKISDRQLENIYLYFQAAASKSILLVSKHIVGLDPIKLSEQLELGRLRYLDTKYAFIIFKELEKKRVDLFIEDFEAVFAQPLDFFSQFLQEKANHLQTMRRNNDIFNLNLVKPPKEKHFFSVVGLFRNESMVIKEWIEHYIKFGVDHFYLVDNKSTDNYQDILQPYIQRGLVTLYSCDQDKYQLGILRELTNILKNETTWVGAFDLDEYIYPPHARTIPDVIRKFDTYDAIVIPWLVFGSNGHVKQPASIVQGFTKRMRYNGNNSHTKSIAKTSAVNILTQHVPWTKKNNHVRSDGKTISADPTKVRSTTKNNIMEFELQNNNLISKTLSILNRPTRINLFENNIPGMELLNNYYALQSLEYFKKVKAERMEVAENCTTVKRIEDFYKLDEMSNEIVDQNLARKTGLE